MKLGTIGTLVFKYPSLYDFVENSQKEMRKIIPPFRLTIAENVQLPLLGKFKVRESTEKDFLYWHRFQEMVLSRHWWDKKLDNSREKFIHDRNERYKEFRRVDAELFYARKDRYADYIKGRLEKIDSLARRDHRTRLARELEDIKDGIARKRRDVEFYFLKRDIISDRYRDAAFERNRIYAKYTQIFYQRKAKREAFDLLMLQLKDARLRKNKEVYQYYLDRTEDFKKLREQNWLMRRRLAKRPKRVVREVFKKGIKKVMVKKKKISQATDGYDRLKAAYAKTDQLKKFRKQINEEIEKGKQFNKGIRDDLIMQRLVANRRTVAEVLADQFAVMMERKGLAIDLIWQRLAHKQRIEMDQFKQLLLQSAVSDKMMISQMLNKVILKTELKKEIEVFLAQKDRIIKENKRLQEERMVEAKKKIKHQQALLLLSKMEIAAQLKKTLEILYMLKEVARRYQEQLQVNARKRIQKAGEQFEVRKEQIEHVIKENEWLRNYILEAIRAREEYQEDVLKGYIMTKFDELRMRKKRIINVLLETARLILYYREKMRQNKDLLHMMQQREFKRKELLAMIAEWRRLAIVQEKKMVAKMVKKGLMEADRIRREAIAAKMERYLGELRYIKRMILQRFVDNIETRQLYMKRLLEYKDELYRHKAEMYLARFLDVKEWKASIVGKADELKLAKKEYLDKFDTLKFQRVEDIRGEREKIVELRRVGAEKRKEIQLARLEDAKHTKKIFRARQDEIKMTNWRHKHDQILEEFAEKLRKGKEEDAA